MRTAFLQYALLALVVGGAVAYVVMPMAAQVAAALGHLAAVLPH